jgi:nucleotide-binding universal stress UspA family protein
MFQSILFPVDFSPACEETAPYVRNLAELTGGVVTLLHVVPWRSAWYGAADVYNETNSHEKLRAMKSAKMCSLAGFRGQYFQSTRCDKRIAFGCVGDQIVDYAEHTGMDLIMMASGEDAHVARPFVSSTLTHVLREAPCPVWTAPRRNALRPFEGLHSLVCALSPEEISGENVNETVA